MSPTDTRVRLDAMIPRELDRALERVAELTGASKAATLAAALAEHLEAVGVLPPGSAAAIEPKPSRGPRRLITETKESNHV